MTRQSNFSLSALLYLFALFLSPSLGQAESDSGDLPPPPENLAQILAYDDDGLFSQGSGVAISGGVVLTSAHYAEGADRLVVADSNGNFAKATVLRRWPEFDLMALKLETGKLALIPARFSHDAPKASDRVVTAGFWNSSLEDERPKRLFGKTRPKFLPKVQENVNHSTGFVREVSDAQVLHLSVLGRGAYGAPVYNTCNEMIGLNHLPEGFTLDDAWARHMPTPPITAISGEKLLSLLGDIEVKPVIAGNSCLNAVSKAEHEKEAAKKQAEKAAKEAESAKQEADKASAQAAKAEAQAEEAEQESKATQQDSVKALSDLSQRLNEEQQKQSAAETAYHKYKIWGAAAGGLLIFLVLALWLKRRHDLKSVNAELKTANAVFHDCLLQGRDSANGPVALRISGRDLARATQGVVIGRNPEGAGVVLGDETVSRNHARLSVEGETLFLEDLGSVNGSRLNGAGIAAHQKHPLKDGDRIELASVDLTLKILEK